MQVLSPDVTGDPVVLSASDGRMLFINVRPTTPFELSEKLFSSIRTFTVVVYEVNHGPGFLGDDYEIVWVLDVVGLKVHDHTGTHIKLVQMSVYDGDKRRSLNAEDVNVRLWPDKKFRRRNQAEFGRAITELREAIAARLPAGGY